DQMEPQEPQEHPEGSIEAVLGKALYAKPTFFGIDERTQLARIVFESDVALKKLTGATSPSLKKKLPFHLSQIEWDFKNVLVLEDLMEVTPMLAVQVLPGEIALATSSDGRVIFIDRADALIRVTAYEVGQPIPPFAADYGKFLTSHFDDYAREVAPLWEYRELVKVLAAARYLKSSGRLADIPLDRSWQPPDRVRATWNAATVGLGQGRIIVTTSFSGGVGLQVQEETRVTTLPAARVEQLTHTAGRASGYPMATRPDRIAAMATADAKANLKRMTTDDLAALRSRITENQSAVDEKIEAIRKQEFRVNLQATSPPKLRTWKDVAKQMITNLPGVGLMKDFSKATAQDIERAARTGPPKPVDWKRTESRYQKFTDDVLKSRDILEKAAKLGGKVGPGGSHNLVESSLIVLREAALAYRAIDESNNWKDAGAKASPHIGNVIKEMPKHIETYAPAATAKSSITLKAGSRASVYLAIATTALDIAYEAANITLINEGVRRDKAANRTLLHNIAGNRQGLEKRRRDNRKLLGLIDERRRGG
ncbi:MAG: hypothetical protein HN420_15565, partial [Rhodospirillaceae bacterium]|nr:hypothetical protein [Rhodospirillaceae bacterium]